MGKGKRFVKKIRGFKDLSLKVKSLLLFSLIVLFPTIALGSLILFEANAIIKQQAFDYTERSLDTIEDNLTATIQDVEDISTYIIFSDEFRRFMIGPHDMEADPKLEEALKGFFTFHLLSKNYINSISIRGINNNELDMGEPVIADEEQWEELAEQGAGKILWSNAYPSYSYWSGEVDVITLYRVINDINDINRKIGFVKIRLNEKILLDFINSGFSNNSASTFILKQDGSVVLHEDNTLYGHPYPDRHLLNKLEQGTRNTSFTYSVNGKRYLVAAREIERSDWQIVTMVSENTILRELKGIGYWIILFFLLSIVLALVSLVGVYVTIIRPVTDLTNKTKQLERGDFTAYVKVTSKDEIGQLGYRFNKMVRKIQQLINTKYKLEIKQRESELKALQNQINPHFLYNTLDMIRWTARLENAMETSRLIEHLSKLFRISLSKGKIWIKVKEELSYVENYLELQKKRFGDKLTFDINIDENIEHALIMKQLLQPLVENSIVHGFKTIKDVGQITIHAFKENKDVIIDIKDNGIGVDIEKQSSYINGHATNEKGGFALSNINDRLSAAFGCEYSFSYLLSDQAGTWVRVRIPMILDEDELKQIQKNR